MAKIKLNSKRSEPKSMKIKRSNVKKQALKDDNSLLQPANDLSKFGKMLFNAIKKCNPTLNNSDNYLLNLLCSEYEIYNHSLNQLNKNGLVTSKGKKSPYYSILKQSIDEITKLSNELDLTPSNRISTAMNQQDNESSDPVVKALKGDGDNE